MGKNVLNFYFFLEKDENTESQHEIYSLKYVFIVFFETNQMHNYTIFIT